MFRAARARRWRWTLTFTEAVRVDTTNGTPSVGLTLGGTAARRAGYLRGDGTVDYVARRTGDGRTKREIIRCLKRMCCNFPKAARERLVESAGLRLMPPLRTSC